MTEASAMTQPTLSDPSYFGSWASYKIPFEPIEPISREVALQLTSYYVAYYNDKGLLVRFEKYLAQQRQWTDEYQYWENGKLRSRHMVKHDESEIQQDFDRHGRIITP